MIEKATSEFLFKIVAATLRHAKTATRNDWGSDLLRGRKALRIVETDATA
jgi:hypothetical protein